MNPDDRVEVTNLDGETAEGELVERTDVTVEHYEISFIDNAGATLLDYWRGMDVDPDERVVRVELGSRTYDYPESRVEVVDDGS